MRTRVFKSGNSLAVRIPKELAFDSAVQEVDIERSGASLVIRQVPKRSLKDIGAIFAMFSPEFMVEGREFHDQRDRNWDE